MWNLFLSEMSGDRQFGGRCFESAICVYFTFPFTGNHGDWRDNVVVFKMPNIPQKGFMQMREYLMKEAEVTPLLYTMRKKGTLNVLNPFTFII